MIPKAELNQSEATPDKLAAVITLELPVEATIACVSDLHTRLRDALHSERPIRLSGAETERTDAAVMQLLGAFALEAERSSRVWEWVEPGSAIRNAAALLGLSAVLMLD